MDPEGTVRACLAANWAGFRADWHRERIRAGPVPTRGNAATAVIAELTGRSPRPSQPQPDTIDGESRIVAARLG
jgi:hypothetical protein